MMTAPPSQATFDQGGGVVPGGGVPAQMPQQQAAMVNPAQQAQQMAPVAGGAAPSVSVEQPSMVNGQCKFWIINQIDLLLRYTHNHTLFFFQWTMNLTVSHHQRQRRADLRNRYWIEPLTETTWLLQFTPSFYFSLTHTRTSSLYSQPECLIKNHTLVLVHMHVTKMPFL